MAENNSDHIVLGADTIVTYESRILGKPSNEDEAKEMLQLLSGKTHDRCCNYSKKNGYFYERTEVTFWELTEELIHTSRRKNLLIKPVVMGFKVKDLFRSKYSRGLL